LATEKIESWTSGLRSISRPLTRLRPDIDLLTKLTTSTLAAPGKILTITSPEGPVPLTRDVEANLAQSTGNIAIIGAPGAGKEGREMNWSALIGAFVGAGVPAVLTYVKVLRDRQAVDAQAIGPAMLLLERMDPLRVMINVGNAEVEEARWKELNQHVDVVRERLLVMAAGHPRRDIRELAKQAQMKLANVRQASGFAVSDLLQNRANPEWVEHAQETHREATDALRELVDASFARRLGRWRLSREPWE
jgi:hypothetical protein